MKRVILSLIALSTVSSIALPIQAKEISTEQTIKTEQTNVKGHRRHGGYRKCYYDHHQHRKVCYWVHGGHGGHGGHHHGHHKK